MPRLRGIYPMKVYKKNGDEIEVPEPSRIDEMKFVASKFEEMESMSEVLDKAMLQFVRRNSMNLASIVNEVSHERSLPFEQATQIVLQMSAVATGNARNMANDYFQVYHNEQAKKHDADTFPPIQPIALKD